MPADNKSVFTFAPSASLFPAEWQPVMALLESSKNGVLFLQKDKIVGVNHSLTDLLGLDASNLVDKPLTVFLSLVAEPAVSPAKRPDLVAVHNSKIRLQHRNGHLIDCHLMINRLDMLPGALDAVWLLDPARQEETASTSSPSESTTPTEDIIRLRAVMENDSSFACICAPDAEILYASPSVLPILGYLPEWLTSTRATCLVHPEDRPKLLAALKRVAINHTSTMQHPVSFRLRRQDGSWRYIAAHLRNLMEHPIIGGLLLHGWDMTEEHREQQQSHTESRRQLHYLNRLLHIALSPQKNTMQALQTIVKAAARGLGVQRCALWNVVNSSASCRCIAMYDDIRQNFIHEETAPTSSGLRDQLLHEVLISEKPMTVENVYEDPRTALFCEYFQMASIKSAILTPVHCHEQTGGVLLLAHLRHTHRWHSDEAILASHIAELVSTVIRNSKNTSETAMFYRVSDKEIPLRPH